MLWFHIASGARISLRGAAPLIGGIVLAVGLSADPGATLEALASRLATLEHPGSPVLLFALVLCTGMALFAEKHLAYPVLNEAGNTVGIVTLRELQHPGATDDGTLKVGAVMTDVGMIEPDDSAYDAFTKICQHPTGRLVVSGPDGKLAGIISKTDLVQAVQLRMIGKATHRRAPSLVDK